MKDAATGFSFLAMCGIAGIFLMLMDYAVDKFSVLNEKSRAYDERMQDEAVIATLHGSILPVGE